jgi:DNA polymerase elongation subunit (family B)
MSGRVIVNAFSIEEREIVIVDRSEGYETRPRLERASVSWACFVKSPLPIRVFRDLKNSKYVRSIFDDANGFLRVNWTDGTTCRAGCEFLAERGIKTYEGNVIPLRRHLIEHGIMPTTPRAVYLDIETDPRPGLANFKAMRVLVIGLIDQATKTKSALVLSEDTDDAERRMLTDLMVRLEAYDQVLAWNGDRFDFELLRSRMRRLGVPGEWRRLLWCDHMLVFKKQNQMAATSGAEKQSVALDNVGMAVLGRGKQEFNVMKNFEEWGAGGARLEKLVEYCLNDVELMADIEIETGYLALFDTLCQATGVFSDTRGLAPSRQVESFMLRLAHERGHKFPTRFVDAEDEEDSKKQFRGAWVMHPKRSGIFENVHVIDFARLYPSVIQSLNLSPETKVGKHEPGTPVPEGCAVSSCGIVFLQEPLGILPAAVAEMLRLRKYWDDEKKKHPPGSPAWKAADRRSTAYKIAVNSFYGVVGSKGSMFFDVDVAESTTLTGRALIEYTVEEATKRLIESIYTDTDSGFLANCTVEECREFVAWCNAELYPEILRTMGSTRNKVALEYEKAFKRLVFCADARTGNPLAKKYAGAYLHFKGKAADATSEPEIKGLEFKRGDSLRMTREFQREAVELLIVKACNDPLAFEPMISTWRTRILEDRLDVDDVKISKSLTRELADYVRKPKKKPINLGDATLEKLERKAAVFSENVFAKIFGGHGHPGGGKLRVPFVDLHEIVQHKEPGDRFPLLLNDYASGSQHVQVARILDANGIPQRMGDRIEFVITDGSTSPKTAVALADWDGVTIDRYQMWHFVWVPTKRLLMGAFPDADWDRWDMKRPPKPRVKKASAKGGAQLNAREVDALVAAVIAEPERPEPEQLELPRIRARKLIRSVA